MRLPRDVGVIVVAAGRGTRAGEGVAKQYRPIAGVPMVLRALRPFVAHPEVAQVVLVLPPHDAASPPEFLAPLQGEMLTIAAGGAERRDSVGAGLTAVSGACNVVLVHDAARPFVARPVIDAVIARARAGESAIAAVPLTDTVKQASAAAPDRVERTIPRNHLWRAQTPQGFPRAVLERAHALPAASAVGGHSGDASAAAGSPAAAPAGRLAAIAEPPGTDDAELVEALGEPVVLVPDSPRNFKVTTDDDFALAELLAVEPE